MSSAGGKSKRLPVQFESTGESLPAPLDAANGGPANRRAAGMLALAFGTQFGGLGVYIPFLPVLLEARGFSAETIGLIIAAPTVVRLGALPLAGWLWDRLPWPRTLLALFGLGAAAMFGALAWADSTLAIVLALLLGTICSSPALVLTDAFAVRLGRMRPVDYGRARLWGSAGFIAGNLVAGFALEFVSTDAITGLIAGPFIVFALIACLLPELPAPRRQPRSATGSNNFVSARLVLGILAAAFAQASHGLLYALSAVHWQAGGLSTGTIGTLWAIGVIAEIVLFAHGAAAIARFGGVPLIAIGGAAAAVRFAAFALDPSLPWLVLLQLLHGLSFGASHLGMIALIAQTVPDRALGRAQGLAMTAVGLVTALAMVLAGPLYAWFGARAFLGSAAIGAVGALLALAALTPIRSPRR